MEVKKLRKWPISKSVSSAVMQIIKGLMVNDTTRRYMNYCNQTDFWYSSSLGVTWPSNRRCSIFGNWIICLLQGVDRQFHTAIFYKFITLIIPLDTFIFWKRTKFWYLELHARCENVVDFCWCEIRLWVMSSSVSNANVYVWCVLQRIMKRHRCRDDSAVFDQNCETSEVVFDAFSLCIRI